MKKYSIQVPFTGYFVVEVEAEDEEKAIEKAFQAEPFKDNNKDGSFVEELNFHKVVVNGNVSSVTLNEIDIEEVE